MEIPQNLPNYTDWLLISGNNISSFNQEILQNSFLPYITKLDISDNRFDNISNEFIDLFTCSRLSFLDISNNNLTMLPSNIQNISSLRDLRLTGNSFQCNCENFWMKDWLNNSIIIEHFTNITCTKPGLSGEEIRMIDMNPKDMDCPVPTILTNWWKILGNVIILNVLNIILYVPHKGGVMICSHFVSTCVFYCPILDDRNIRSEHCHLYPSLMQTHRHM